MESNTAAKIVMATTIPNTQVSETLAGTFVSTQARNRVSNNRGELAIQMMNVADARLYTKL